MDNVSGGVARQASLNHRLISGKHPACAFLCLAIAFATIAAPAALATPSITLSPASGAPTEIVFQDTTLKFSAKGNVTGGSGGFIITDNNAKKDVVLRNGKVAKNAATGALHHTASSGDLVLRATFTPSATDNSIDVTGEIESTKPADRALIVRYVLPLPLRAAESPSTATAIYQNNLGESHPIGKDAIAIEPGTVIPIAAMTGKDWGVALSIPPTFPGRFAMTGGADGLGVEFHLGLAPGTRALPGKAAFKFTISPATPGWGFRSALAAYFKRHDEHYRLRHNAAGFRNWNDSAGIGTPDETLAGRAWSLLGIHAAPKPAPEKTKALDLFNACLLHNAGWQPVTHAKTDTPNIVCERFGSGDFVYFTLLNWDDKPADCLLKVDMNALELAHSTGATTHFSEVARNTRITGKQINDIGHVSIKLEPMKTYIIKLSRTW